MKYALSQKYKNHMPMNIKKTTPIIPTMFKAIIANAIKLIVSSPSRCINYPATG